MAMIALVATATMTLEHRQAPMAAMVEMADTWVVMATWVERSAMFEMAWAATMVVKATTWVERSAMVEMPWVVMVALVATEHMDRTDHI